MVRRDKRGDDGTERVKPNGRWYYLVFAGFIPATHERWRLQNRSGARSVPSTADRVHGPPG
jgi:glucan-binding YG repeat protein